jgi:alpha-tubulin suppressor-like RCC1 family protein
MTSLTTELETTTVAKVPVSLIVGDTTITDDYAIGDYVQAPTIDIPEGQVLVGWYEGDESCQVYDKPWHFDEDQVEDQTFICARFVDEENQIHRLDSFIDSNDSIQEMVGGIFYSLALTSNGKLYLWGSLYALSGQLPQPPSEITEISDQFNLMANENIVDIDSGILHILVLTSLGRVFVMGDNTYGQLSDTELNETSTPVDITDNLNLNENETVESIETGYYYNAILTNQNRILMWGYNYYGQLGDGTEINQYSPVDITHQFNFEGDEFISQIRLSAFNSMVLTTKGRLFIWGDGHLGQLGNMTTVLAIDPVEINQFFNLGEGEEIDQIGLGVYHSLALTNQGQVYAWGSNETGKLGIESESIQISPVNITHRFELEEDEKIQTLWVGGAFNSVLTNRERFFVWGRNHVGQLGTFDFEDKNKPVDIRKHFYLKDNQTITYVEMAGLYTFVVVNDQIIYAFGSNEYGELGFPEE